MKTPQDLSFLAKTLIQYGLVLGSIGLGGFLAGDFLLTNWANLATTSGDWIALGGGVVTSITSAVVVRSSGRDQWMVTDNGRFQSSKNGPSCLCGASKVTLTTS